MAVSFQRIKVIVTFYSRLETTFIHVKNCLPSEIKNILLRDIKIILPWDIKNILPSYVKNSLPHDIKIMLPLAARQSMVKFVVRAMDLDEDWNTYIANLDNLGLQKILDMNQKAYTRQYGK